MKIYARKPLVEKQTNQKIRTYTKQTQRRSIKPRFRNELGTNEQVSRKDEFWASERASEKKMTSKFIENKGNYKIMRIWFKISSDREIEHRNRK